MKHNTQLTATSPLIEMSGRCTRLAIADRVIKDYLGSLPELPRKRRPTIPANASARERWARQILGPIVNNDCSLGPNYGHYVSWERREKYITLDSRFTLRELEALVWWMKNKKAPGKRKSAA